MFRNVAQFLLLVCGSLAALQYSHALPTGFQTEQVVAGVEKPVYLQELPDGRMLLLTQEGIIYSFNPYDLPVQLSIYLTLPDVESGGERGLQSIALDPDFATTGNFYVYYTHATSARFRISRFIHTGTVADPTSEVVIWEASEDWADCCHYGGGLAFGPDEKLYLTTGEMFDGSASPDLTRSGGKIIRINKDGSIPADNPYVDGEGGNLDEVWAIGLRNPYRAYWDLVKDRLYISEVGGNVQETAREDLHIGRKGADYGWPACEGQCSDSAYDDPIYDYGHTEGTPSGGAITAGFVYRGGTFPNTYQEAFFFADYALGFIKYLTLNEDGSVASVHDFADGDGSTIAPVNLIQGSDGALYYVDYLNGVNRIVFSNGNQAPEIEFVQAIPGQGDSPLTVDFVSSALDQESTNLIYTWFFGTGDSALGQNSDYTYVTKGEYDVYLTVSDGERSTISSPIKIQVGQLPSAQINSPADGQLFRAGELVDFFGYASDTDGAIDESSYEWSVDFGHNAHIHPALSGYSGSAGQIQINTSGHDYHDNTSYIVKLKVTDSDGLSVTDQVTIYPEKVDLNINAVPAGIPVFIDGISHVAPFTYDSLIGFNHVISAPDSYCLNDVTYEFDNWSTGQTKTHSLVVPDTDFTFQANYTAAGSCAGLSEDGLVFRVDGSSIVESNGVVNQWLDISGKGNHLSALGNPTVIDGGLSGKDIVDFDGEGDYLTRINNITDLPVENEDRTMIAVVNYRGDGWGGIAYGDAACNGAFGAIVDHHGNLTLQGWCNDFQSKRNVLEEGWFVHAVVYDNGTYKHFQNGYMIGSGSHEFATGSGSITLGAEIDGSPAIDMQIAAVYIYDRAFTDVDISNAQTILESSYLNGEPPLAQDDSASLVQGGMIDINVLNNDSDSDGTLNIASVTIESDPAYGAVLVDANGVISYSHNGSSSTADSFTYTVEDTQGVVSNVATVTLSVSASDGSVSISSPLAGETIEGTEFTVTYNLAGSDYDHVHLSLDDGAAVELGALSGSYTFTQVDAGIHAITAQLVNSSHQAIESASAVATVSFNVNNDGVVYVPVANDDNASVSAGESVEVNVLANDTDGNDDIDASSVTITAQPNYGTLSTDVNGIVIYSHLGGSFLPDSFTYIVYDALSQQSNEATVSINVTAAGVPGNGLVLQLEASGINDNGGAVTSWTDMSGQGNHLDSVAGDPQVVLNGVNGHAVLDFDGSSDELARNGSINGLPSGSEDRTVVLVANYRGVGYGGFAYGTPSCNQTFGLAVTSGANLLVQGWCNDFSTNIAGTGAGWIVQSAVVSSGTMDHYLNGSLIDSETHDYNTVVNSIVLGAEIDSSPAVDMQVAAVYIYDRALSSIELAELHGYLQSYYFGAQAPQAADEVVDVVQGGNVVIDVLANDSDSDGSLDVSSVSVVTAPGNGVAEVDAVSGQITYRHGGASTVPDSFQYTVADNQGIVSNIATVSIGVLEPDASVTITSPTAGETINGTEVVVTYSLAGSDYNRLHLSLDGSGHSTIMDMTGSYTFSEVDAGTHTISAQLVNGDHQAIASENAYTEVTFTVENGGVNYSPVTANDSASVGLGGSVQISVLNNDSDADGDLDASSVLVVSAPANGTTSVDELGVISYSHDGSGYNNDSFSYQVYDALGQVSNIATVSISVNGAGVPASGLVLQLEAGSIEASGGTVTSWTDMSGQGNNLDEVAGNPQLIANGLNGQAIVDFDGSGDELSRSAAISGLPSGGADRTVVMVANYRGVGYGGFAYGTPACNQTFGLAVTPGSELLVQGWCSDYKSGVTGTGAGWLVQTAVVDGGTMSQYINGGVVSTVSHNYDTLVGSIVLGAEIDKSPAVDMQVAAVYVYDRALSAEELVDLHAYLQVNYGL
ncbi:Glucose/arabinose dehydrogenase, beta-propeller fold [Alteromonadaceae bacterium Bs31]|nr:Glucose/arabinose dehydrogenase, beta-propeller fold [Alteromonadaceae bacterium Bs31]